MTEKVKKIGEFEIKAKTWAFFKLMERKTRILKIIGGASDTIMDLLDTDSDSDGVNEIIGIIKNILESLDESTLRWFIGIVFENVTIDGEDFSKEEIQDKYLSGNSSLFYDVLIFVLEVNYGDFLEKLKGKLPKVTAEITSES